MSEYEVRSVIICDEARREISGKEILVGVYNDVIVVGEFPAAVERLFVRIALRAPVELEGTFKFAIWGSGPEALAAISGIVARAPADDRNRIFGLGLRGLYFEKAGVYQIRFGFNVPETTIADFEVRQPVDSAEKERLALIN